MNIIGHERQLQLLSSHRARGRVGHAYLFSGVKHVGKTAVAEAFAASLLCEKPPAGGVLPSCGTCSSCHAMVRGIHPQVFTVSSHTQKKEGAAHIGITAMRMLKSRVARSAFADGYKLFFVEDASSLTREAANAFLKVLEEPLGRTVFFLIAHNPDALLATIVSRAARVQFWPVSEKHIAEGLRKRGVEAAHAELAAFLALGRPGVAVRYSLEPIETLTKERIRLERDVLTRGILGTAAERFQIAVTLTDDPTRYAVWYSEAMALLGRELARQSGRALLRTAERTRRVLENHPQMFRAYVNKKLALEAMVA